MTDTLILGLRNNPQLLQIFIDNLPATFKYANYFPLTSNITFKWETLKSQSRRKNVAADIVADNSSARYKRRPLFESATGDLPYIKIARKMERDDIKNYQIALALAGNADAQELIRYWADDAEFCFNGIHAEMEYLAWAILSNACKLGFTGANNDGIATEFDLDYQVDDDQKQKVTVAFTEKATADFIGACAAAVQAGKARGFTPKYAFMNLFEFYKVQSMDQVIRGAASFAANALNISQVPDLAAINAWLAKQPYVNGLQIVVVDTEITREIGNDESVINPFADSRIVFSPTLVLGSTQYSKLRKDAKQAIIAERTLATITKYSENDPYQEITLGEADAIPVMDTAYHNIYLRTDADDWGAANAGAGGNLG
jgi:hypothetical protein